MTLPPDALPFWDDAETFNKYFNPDWSDRKNWHEAANFFPLMGDADLADVAETIKKKGLEFPIAIFEGKVLDGRNRILACKIAGARPTFEIVKRTLDFDPLDFVIRRNSKRRDLTKDQRAAIAAKLVLTELAKEARDRQIEAGRKHGAEGGRGKKKQKPLGQKRPKSNGRAAELAANRIGKVSATYVKKVLRSEKKKPGLVDRIVAGEITIGQAKEEADRPFRRNETLGERYKVHPFTVFNARQFDWLARKAEWREIGVEGGHSEQENSSMPETDSMEDTSAFDPVLAEFICRFFVPRGGRVFDPFAGEAVKGIVAAKLGLDYVGIDVRKDQIEKNQTLAKKLGLAPTWHFGDSALDMQRLVPELRSFDLIFTSPPYYDTEIYSDMKDKDGSAFESYEKFLPWYEDIFRQAVDRLKPNRFLVVKVGEGTRNKQGFFNNLVGDSISCFRNMKELRYYNTAVLATSLGSAPMRVEHQFPNNRKLVGTHQNVLFFFKGDDPSVIPVELGPPSDLAQLDIDGEESSLLRRAHLR